VTHVVVVAVGATRSPRCSSRCRVDCPMLDLQCPTITIVAHVLVDDGGVHVRREGFVIAVFAH
jgi:hypothetical protein